MSQSPQSRTQACLLTRRLQVLAAFGTIGGALFGFDISSMSAWIGTPQYLDYFNSPGSTQQGGVGIPVPL